MDDEKKINDDYNIIYDIQEKVNYLCMSFCETFELMKFLKNLERKISNWQVNGFVQMKI